MDLKEDTRDQRVYVRLVRRKTEERKQVETKQSQENLKLP